MVTIRGIKLDGSDLLEGVMAAMSADMGPRPKWFNDMAYAIKDLVDAARAVGVEIESICVADGPQVIRTLDPISGAINRVGAYTPTPSPPDNPDKNKDG